MKIEIEPTGEWFYLDGTLCRVWKTTGADHAEARLFIAGCQLPKDGHPHATEFERELIELFQKVAPGLCGDSSANPALPCTEPSEHNGVHRHGEALSWPRAESDQ